METKTELATTSMIWWIQFQTCSTRQSQNCLSYNLHDLMYSFLNLSFKTNLDSWVSFWDLFWNLLLSKLSKSSKNSNYVCMCVCLYIYGRAINYLGWWTEGCWRSVTRTNLKMVPNALTAHTKISPACSDSPATHHRSHASRSNWARYPCNTPSTLGPAVLTPGSPLWP
jgi:hypothetical protein